MLGAGFVFTVRYYYHKVPVGTSMIIAGLLMTAIAYLLIKYLKDTKAGFTSQAKTNGHGGASIEALLIAEILSGQQDPHTGTHFGGGGYGGGGCKW